LTAAIHRIDAVLRRRQGIEEFSDAEYCMFRIAPGTSDEDVVLADGTHVRQGDPIAELHFWNEQMPHVPRSGPDLAWARRAQQQAVRSLEDLAAYVQRSERLREVDALRGDLAVAGLRQRELWTRAVRRVGFEVRPRSEPAGPVEKVHRFGEDVLIWGLTWAFNPASLRGKGVRRQRLRCWMSRSVLLGRYAARPADIAGQGSRLPE
jgi:hypothetical protein